MAEPVSIDYEFIFSDKRQINFSVRLDPITLQLIPDPQNVPPNWAALEYSQCSNCPLVKADCANCPIAASLHTIVSKFQSEKSFEDVTVLVKTLERNYSKVLPLQKGIQSLFGLIMATSGCPIMSFLKPMARFHLPFSNAEETMVRSTAMYLLGQYFKYKSGEAADWDMAQLDQKYAEISRVNEGLAARMNRAKASEISNKSGDATPNAIVILDAFAQILTMEIENNLSGLEYLFN